MSKNKNINIVGATLLIAGTCIGAGMLGIPTFTGLTGFYPTMLINVIAWLFMLMTGWLFLDVTLWMHDGANLLSMSKRFLGRPGQSIAAVSFLFLYYCLLVGYFAGSAPTLISILDGIGIHMSNHSAFIAFGVALLIILFLGTLVIDRINFILVFGLIISFVIMIVLSKADIEVDLLARQEWKFCLLGMPILFAAYGYHNIIPSMSTYLKRNVRALKWTIFFGSLLPFIIYSIWQWLLIGSMPKEAFEQTLSQGVPITQTMQTVFKSSWVSVCARYFAFFAIVTSTLGVALSMVDFLGDGFNIKKRRGFKRLILCLLVVVPPLVFVWHNPNIFHEALGIAGGYGEAILNGLFPIIMVWIGKYHFKLKSNLNLISTRPILTLLFIFTLFIMLLETLHILKIQGF